MRKLIFMVLAGIVFPLCTQAQLARMMARYHEQPCVTVTQLDKSLYDLYKKNNLPPEAEEMLKNLDEVNFLNLSLSSCPPDFETNVAKAFREVLSNPENYRLIKSHNNELGKQMIYTKTQDGKVSDLVVWSQSPTRLDIIELRGKIQLEKVALLSKALNIRGLRSLSALSPDNEIYNNYKQSYSFSGDFNDEMEQMSREMRDMAEKIQLYYSGADFGNFMNDIFGSLGTSFDKMGDMFQQFGDAANVMSNSVQITEQNGKTKIKIDSKNTDMIYVVDGKEIQKTKDMQLPENIRNVNVVPSKTNIKKSYLFITSKNKIGDFISYKDGVLTFRYENQEYTYNLGKAQNPLLIVNGELCSDLIVEPSGILQIRPLSAIEKEASRNSSAEVMILTR